MSKAAINKIKYLLGMEVSLEQLKTESGAILEADEFAPGNQVFVLNDAGEKMPTPEGEIPMEDGQILVVNENSEIVSYGNMEEAQPEKEQEMEKEQPAKKVVESITKETHFEETKKETPKEEVKEVFFSDAAKQEITEIVLAVLEAQKETKEDVKEELSEVKPMKHSPEKERETVKFNFSTERTSKQAQINKFLFG